MFCISANACLVSPRRLQKSNSMQASTHVVWYSLHLLFITFDGIGGSSACLSRASSFVQDETRGHLVYEPFTYGHYSLFRSYESVEDVRTGFECFLGQTGYPDPQKLYTQPDFDVRVGRYYYHELGDPPATLSTKHMYPWVTDPTNSMANYERGCQHLGQLVVPRRSHANESSANPAMRSQGFVLQAMHVPKIPNYNFSASEGVWALRLESKDVYNGGLFVIKVNKMPYGGAVWPAIWLLGSSPREWIQFRSKETGLGMKNSWPSHGEIDMIEYVNANCEESDGRNQVTLHTRYGCTSTVSDSTHNNTADSRCDHYGSNFGCYGKMQRNTVGSPDFAGGYFVYEWSVARFVKGWFFDETEWQQLNAQATDDSIQTGTFPKPHVEHNLQQGCSDPSMFQNMRIVINTAVCGDWAGNVKCTSSDDAGISYEPPNCKASVMDYLRTIESDTLPDSFSWDISFIKVYT